MLPPNVAPKHQPEVIIKKQRVACYVLFMCGLIWEAATNNADKIEINVVLYNANRSFVWNYNDRYDTQLVKKKNATRALFLFCKTWNNLQDSSKPQPSGQKSEDNVWQKKRRPLKKTHLGPDQKVN